LARQPLLLLIPAILFAAAATTTALTTGPTVCPYRLLTGLPCAGCGLTRGFVALAHFDLHAALHFHPLTPIVMGAMVLWWAVAVSRLAHGAEPLWIRSRYVILAMLLTVSFWLARDISELRRPGALDRMASASVLARWCAAP
jgi:hypothetical protein